jgi:hypothetical protein
VVSTDDVCQGGPSAEEGRPAGGTFGGHQRMSRQFSITGASGSRTSGTGSLLGRVIDLGHSCVQGLRWRRQPAARCKGSKVVIWC